jgi:signal transduction histidine kinase
MLTKFIKYLFVIDLDFDIKKYKKEFETVRTQNNISKCSKGGIALLLLNLILIAVDLRVYSPRRVETPAYLYLYYSHIIVSLMIVFWYGLLFVYKKCSYAFSGKVIYYFFIYLILYWCVFMGINGLNISGQISAYIIGPLALGAGLYLNPFSAFVIYFSSLLIFIAGLIFSIVNKQILNSHIINAAIAVLFSQVISNLNFTSLVKDFIYKKKLLEKKLELEEANQRLREYERLRTDFFANISHELRTPLNVIHSAQQMIAVTLEKEGHRTPKTEKYIGTIKQNSYRLLRLINNLIDITRIDAASFEVKLINADIIKITEDVTLSVADYVQSKDISLTFDTELEEKVIVCDPDAVERILLNLLSNAVKFTNGGGSIFVNIFVNSSHVCIAVKDNGIGIPKDMLSMIFDRFIQVDKSINRRCEGSGIGLSIVKSLVDMHKGYVYVDSTLGEGSEFIVALPDAFVEECSLEAEAYVSPNDYIEKVSLEFSDIYD